jgi:hypothetical protein
MNKALVQMLVREIVAMVKFVRVAAFACIIYASHGGAG